MKGLRGLKTEMDNLTLNQQQNWTVSFCGEHYITIYFVMDIILLLFSFPTTIAVILILLSRIYNAKSFSPAEVFLLQINFINLCLFVHHLLCFLNNVRVIRFSMILYNLFYIPSLTARPIFLLAICVIFYLAIVHPVTYMTAKTLCHWEWLVTTLGWLYTLAIFIIIIYEIDIFHPIFMVLFHIAILPIMFLNTATLKVLSSSGPGHGKQTLNPAKRKAFGIILSIQVILLLYYVPHLYFYIYLFIVPADMERFVCSEGLAVMMLPQFSEFAMPVIFLYSLAKLGIDHN